MGKGRQQHGSHCGKKMLGKACGKQGVRGNGPRDTTPRDDDGEPDERAIASMNLHEREKEAKAAPKFQLPLAMWVSKIGYQ